MTSGDRVKQVRKANKLTLEKFGERLGVAKTTISRIENGINGLTEQMCKSICREFKVSEAWLKGELEGDDIVYEETPSDDAGKFASDHNLDKTEEVLIREYLKLSDGERAIFRKYLKNVLSELDDIATATDQRGKEIDQKVEEYREELEAEAASNKSEASQTGSEDIVDEA